MLKGALLRAGLDPDRARVTPLDGGITNRSFRVAHGADVLVVRLAGNTSGALGIDRRAERVAMRAAWELGVGAEVVYTDDRGDILVTRFIEGRVLDAATAVEPEMLARIARTLAKVHAGPRFEGRFSPIAAVREYLALAEGRGSSLPPSAARACAIAWRLEPLFASTDDDRPCHDDLLPGNLIDTGEALRVIDWEYARMGDPFFDLGNFAANVGLDDALADHLLTTYLGRPPRERERARLALMKIASDAREGFWGVAQDGAAEIDFDFAGYARDHLDRAVARASTPDFERWCAALAVRS